MNIDRESLLVHLDAETTLGDAEDKLRAEGFTLGILRLEEHRALPVGEWLASGAPDGPDAWSDPADHLLAGVDATLPNGELLSVLPAPRRSTGPDLIALLFGMRGRFARITRAWVRIHTLGATLPRTHAFDHPRDPPLTTGEEALLASIERALRS